MIVYKLTDQNNKRNYDNLQWGENVTHITSCEGGLYGPGFIPAYATPHHAALFNPIHDNFDMNTMHLWECEGSGIKNNGIKMGCTQLTSLKQIKIPEISAKQKLYFIYLCVCDILCMFENDFHPTKEFYTAFEIIKKYLNSEKINQNKIINFIKNIKFISYVNISLESIKKIYLYTYSTIKNIIIYTVIPNNICKNTINNYMSTITIAISYLLSETKIKLINNNIKKMIEFS